MVSPRTTTTAPLTKGWKTSEFYLALASEAGSILVALHVFSVSANAAIQKDVQTAAMGVTGLVPVVYGLGRSILKAFHRPAGIGSVAE